VSTVVRITRVSRPVSVLNASRQVNVLSHAAAHAASHIRAGTDEIDGDKLDIDWNPSNYTPTTVAEADNADHLAAHLKGIDNALADAAGGEWTESGLTGTADRFPYFGALGAAVLKTAAEVRALLGDAIAALGALTPAADRLPYFTGSATAALTTLSSYSRTLLALDSKAAWRNELGLGAGGPTLLASVDAPSGGELTLEGVDPTGYVALQIVLIGVQASVDQSNVIVKLRSGGAVLSGFPYEWAVTHRTGLTSASSTAEASTGPDDQIRLTINSSASWGLGNGATEALSGEIKVFDPAADTGAERPFTIHCGYVNSGSSGNYVQGGGACNNTADAIQGVTVTTTTTSSTITAGRIRIYGVP
jgi:hypothetical protein